MTEKRQLKGLRRGFNIIQHLASSSEGITFNRLRSLCSLPAPTLSRVLKVLIELNMVEKDRAYRLGRGFMKIARTASGRISREEIIKPVLDRLAHRTGESAAYFEPEGTAIILRAKSEQGESWHYMDIGNRNQRITRNGFGQVCCAFTTAKRRKRILEEVYEPPQIGKKQFNKRMDSIREKGIYFEQGEASHAVQRFTAPVLERNNEAFAGSIGITMMKRRLTAAEKEQFSTQVQQAAQDASRLLSRHTFSL